MHYTLFTRVMAEFFGTAFLLILGNGSVANVELKGTKGTKGGWILIGIGYGCGVLIPAMMIGHVSGNHINPAFTIGLALNGMFPWNEVVPYVVAQFAGAIVGQLVVVWCYKPYYDKTTDPEAILGTFSTIDAVHSNKDGMINEFFGSFILFFGALCMTGNIAFESNIGLANFCVGILVGTLVVSLGGATGPALNPARDLGPRLLHALLPLKHKGSSQWDYSWVPVLAPILGATAAVFAYKQLFV
ncbi:MIP/aquaporin family protein [Loigolactobacillus bifermentans]|nr:MIP/aquaporin family protein [Loigolactobacillus bifermentans]QGG61383.1 MIP family channel protein [Loigolactobacillus bifermentans]